jgi:hypothetical protein
LADIRVKNLDPENRFQKMFLPAFSLSVSDNNMPARQLQRNRDVKKAPGQGLHVSVIKIKYSFILRIGRYYGIFGYFPLLFRPF